MPDPTPEPSRKPEVDAMQAICRALEPLDHEQRVRVLSAVLCLLDPDVATEAVRRWRRAT